MVSSSPILADEDSVHEILVNMMKQESTVYKRTDYLTLSLSSHLQDEVIDGSWRQRIIEWMYGVVDHCNLRRDSVAVAAYFLDLSSSRGLVRSRREFQLVAMTSLMLSIKLYDSTCVKLDSMVKLGRGLFNAEDVIETESKMLNALNWHVHPPTPVCFMRQLLRLLPLETSSIARYMIVEVTRFVSEISACLYKFVRFSSSTMAFAGILIAMERVDGDTLPLWQRQQFLVNMASVTGLESTSPEIQDAVQDLRVSLEHNVNLHELMRTITAQCHLGHSTMRIKSNEEENSDEQISRGAYSPRDVTSTCDFR
jgi:hypothetical protein